MEYIFLLIAFIILVSVATCFLYRKIPKTPDYYQTKINTQFEIIRYQNLEIIKYRIVLREIKEKLETMKTELEAKNKHCQNNNGNIYNIFKILHYFFLILGH